MIDYAEEKELFDVRKSKSSPYIGKHRKSCWASDIVVVVPARNEGSAISDTLTSLTAQTTPPSQIVVVVNNSDDDTAVQATRFAGPETEVLTMPGRNQFKKAGALNYGIRHLISNGTSLPDGIRYVLTIDGDTDLEPHFLERAHRVMEADHRLGGVSAACLGKPLHGKTIWSRLLLTLQRIEYGRFAATRLRRNVHTMSGAGSFYRAEALNDLLSVRTDVFEERSTNLVEDYETTLALKQRGWRVTSNQQCIAYTDLMPSMRMLLAQRVRWVRGTVDEWRRYGWCRATYLSMLNMIAGVFGIGYAAVWMTVSIAGIVAHGGMIDSRYFLLATFWALYQGWSVKDMGWRTVLFEVALLPEVAFNLVRNYWLVKSIFTSYLGRAPKWS